MLRSFHLLKLTALLIQAFYIFAIKLEVYEEHSSTYIPWHGIPNVCKHLNYSSWRNSNEAFFLRVLPFLAASMCACSSKNQIMQQYSNHAIIFSEAKARLFRFLLRVLQNQRIENRPRVDTRKFEIFKKWMWKRSFV